MKSDIERLQSEAISREESLSELEKLLQVKKEMISPHSFNLARHGLGDIRFRFSHQSLYGFDPDARRSRYLESGRDLGGCPANGIVSDIGNDNAVGKIVVIFHGFGMTSRYGHLNKVFVKIGQRVKRGDKIAEVGMTGKTTGPHLHYEVKTQWHIRQPDEIYLELIILPS